MPEVSYPKWSRVSFACTDGIELLSVAGTDLPPEGRRSRLLQLAEQGARATPQGATDVHVEVLALGDSEDRPQVRAYRSYAMENGEGGQTAYRWLVDHHGEALMLALGSPCCVPKQELIDEIDAVAASWRSLTKGGEPPKKRLGARDALPSRSAEAKPVRKPWWRIW
jgi:hypothetical protein